MFLQIFRNILPYTHYAVTLSQVNDSALARIQQGITIKNTPGAEKTVAIMKSVDEGDARRSFNDIIHGTLR
jgi:hypothetical protein